MAGTEQSYEFVKGEDGVITWTIRQADSDAAPVQDITGWSFSFKIKRSDADPDPPVATGTAAIVNPTAGTLTVTIPAATMETLSGDYRHSLWRTNAGAARCLSRGYFSVIDSTQDA